MNRKAKKSEPISDVIVFVKLPGQPLAQLPQDLWAYPLVVSLYSAFLLDKRRIAGKKVADKTRAAVLEAKIRRAWAMFREWYLDVPKRERPLKSTVESDIANRLNKEFPGSPTKPRTVRAYLASRNSEKF